jgi:hypothetical protein
LEEKGELHKTKATGAKVTKLAKGNQQEQDLSLGYKKPSYEGFKL